MSERKVFTSLASELVESEDVVEPVAADELDVDGLPVVESEFADAVEDEPLVIDDRSETSVCRSV